MAITTLDGVIAGFQTPQTLAKLGITMSAVGPLRAYTPWYANGTPGASTATAIGINGEACTPALGSVGSRIRRTNPVTGNAHLGRLAMQSSAAGTLWLIDRLWQNSGLSTTSTVAQAITPVALPARSADGTANGADVMAAIEWSAAGGAGTPTVTLTYTDQDGNAGMSALMTAVTAPPSGTFEIFSLAAGDTGIRSVQSFIQSATRTSGTMHLVLFRLIAPIECTAPNVGNAIDALTSGMPRIYNDSVLQTLWFPTATAGVNMNGQYIETHG
jgi:hypothetical protein